MLIKNIEFSSHQRNTKTQFSQNAHVSWFIAIHHLKAEIESFKIVCNMPLELFLAETKESPIYDLRDELLGDKAVQSNSQISI